MPKRKEKKMPIKKIPTKKNIEPEIKLEEDLEKDLEKDLEEDLEEDLEKDIEEKLEVKKKPLEFAKVGDPTQMYLGEIGFSPLLSAEEEVYYSRLVQKGDQKARAKMIESNLRLVVKIARRYYRRGLEFLDL